MLNLAHRNEEGRVGNLRLQLYGPWEWAILAQRNQAQYCSRVPLGSIAINTLGRLCDGQPTGHIVFSFCQIYDDNMIKHFACQVSGFISE